MSCRVHTIDNPYQWLGNKLGNITNTYFLLSIVQSASTHPLLERAALQVMWCIFVHFLNRLWLVVLWLGRNRPPSPTPKTSSLSYDLLFSFREGLGDFLALHEINISLVSTVKSAFYRFACSCNSLHLFAHFYIAPEVPSLACINSIIPENACVNPGLCRPIIRLHRETRLTTSWVNFFQDMTDSIGVVVFL